MPAVLLVAGFVVVPLVELFVVIQVGQVIGAWWTIGLLVVESLIGAAIVKREGRKAWTKLQQALRSGQMPGRELADGALLIVGGTLLLTPGFVTDVFGFFCVLPFTRPVARRLVLAYASRRASRSVHGYARTRGGVHQIYDDGH